MAEESVWRSRLRWRWRGALQWPVFAALTVLDAVLLGFLPIAGDEGTDFVPALLLAMFFNLVAVALLAPLVAMAVRRRRPGLARDLAELVLAGAGADRPHPGRRAAGRGLVRARAVHRLRPLPRRRRPATAAGPGRVRPGCRGTASPGPPVRRRGRARVGRGIRRMRRMDPRGAGRPFLGRPLTVR